jgi:hypothetical protein
MDAENEEWWAAPRVAHHDHLAEVGWFFLSWAQIESDLYTVLLHYANMDNKVGRSLLSGTRAKAMLDMLYNLCENTDIAPARCADLKFIGSQLTVINNIRDRLAHHGEQSFAMIGEVGFSYITNATRAGRETRTFFYRISTTRLIAISEDLTTITQALARHLEPDPFVPLDASGDVGAWHCKPLEQDDLPTGGWYSPPPKLTPRR